MAVRLWGALVALAIVLVVAASWPLVQVMDTHLLGRLGDPDLGAGIWWSHSFVDCVLELRNPFFRPELAWPEGQDVRLLLWNVGAQVLLFPVHALLDPVPALNAAVLVVGVANGVACGWAGWRLTRDPWGAAAAVVVGTASAYAIWESGVGRTEQGLWAPLAVWLGGMLWLRDGGGKKAVLVAGIGLGVTGSCYWFYAWFGVLFTLLLAAWWRKPSALGVLGVSLVVVLPSLALIAPAFFEEGNHYALLMNRLEPLAQKNAGALEVPGAFLLQLTTEPARKVPILLVPAVLGAMVFRPLRIPAAIAASAVIFALGPVLVGSRGFPLMWGDLSFALPAALMDWLPGHERFWWPYRWLGLGLPAFAICVAGLVARARRFRPVAVAALAIVCVADARVGLRNDRPVEHVWIESNIPEMPELHGPILVWPLARVPNDLIGYQVIHGQPQGGGIAWDMSPAMRGAEWERRLVELGVFVALEEARRNRPITGDWSETAGFRYVLATRPGLRQHLGEPLWTDRGMSLFALPSDAEASP